MFVIRERIYAHPVYTMHYNYMHSCNGLILRIALLYVLGHEGQEVSCRMEALWYVLSKNIWYYGESLV